MSIQVKQHTVNYINTGFLKIRSCWTCFRNNAHVTGKKILQFCKKPCQHRLQDAFCLDIATSCHSSHRENLVGEKTCFRAKFLFPRIHGPIHDLWIRSIVVEYLDI